MFPGRIGKLNRAGKMQAVLIFPVDYAHNNGGKHSLLRLALSEYKDRSGPAYGFCCCGNHIQLLSGQFHLNAAAFDTGVDTQDNFTIPQYYFA